MSLYSDTFTNRHVVLPVIHVVDSEQTIRNTEIAQEAGADGVFLINHDIPYTAILPIHSAVSNTFPDFWIGLNLLDTDPVEVFSRLDESVKGVWVDNALIDERNLIQAAADLVSEKRSISGWQGLYFGGVAFKYQREVSDLERATEIASNYMDVITTSGSGTGKAADPEKISRMKSSAGGTPLAIASGITPDNISTYLPYADCFLVATGICRTIDELDHVKTKRLIEIIRSY